MKVGIHQPNYLPWGGYFYKILNSGAFVFLDDVQYTKNSLINRNRVKTAQGPAWLTVDVLGSISKTISEIAFADNRWRKRHKNTLHMNYAKTPFFADYAEGIFSVIDEAPALSALNIALIRHISQILGAECEFYLSSELKSDKTGEERLIELIQKLGGSVYLSGKGGANYQSEESYAKAGIALEYTGYTQREYPQLWGAFETNLSVIDLLFNCGEKTREIILEGAG